MRGVRFLRSRKAAPDCKASIRLSITPVSSPSVERTKLPVRAYFHIEHIHIYSNSHCGVVRLQWTECGSKRKSKNRTTIRKRQTGQRAKRATWLPKCTNALRRWLTYGEEPEDESVHWWPLTGIRSAACTGELSALYQDLVWSRSILGLFIIVRWQWDVPWKQSCHRSATCLHSKWGSTSKKQWGERLAQWKDKSHKFWN